MWKYFILHLIIICGGQCNNTTQLLVNTTNVNDNSRVEMERITQPSAQTQQIERTVPEPVNISATISLDGGRMNKSDFRPSPHLETYYEFNKSPVPPALAEAKIFGDLPLIINNGVQWPDKFVPTTEQPWTTRIKFPSPSVPTSKDRPYQFYSGLEKSQDVGKSFGYPTKFDGYSPNSKPTVTTNFEHSIDNVNKVPLSGEGGSWDYNINNFADRRRPQTHKQAFDFTLPVAVPSRPYEGNTHKVHYDYNLEERPQSDVGHYEGNPWKKIIKFLTAFIPIGLLISALTPTVITVTSVNGTSSRSRAEDSTANHHQTKLMNSLNYFTQMSNNGCESRILCELLVSASTSKNAEQHVQNLLNTFTDDGKAVKKSEEDMKRIFDAVKKQDCRPIACKSIRETT